MEKRRGLLVVMLFAVICMIAVSATYIYTNPDRGRVADEEAIGVVVTILPQADFVHNVAGDKVRVTVMVPPGASPHTYEPTPGQLMEVSKARIYLKVGSGVEFEQTWLDKIIGDNPEIQVVNCSYGITKQGNDPHIWNSPNNAKIMVTNICNGLVAFDPGNATFYSANRDNYLQELDTLDTYIHDRLAKNATNRVFMIYHPAFGYFAKDYNLTQIAIEHKGKAPTPKVIRDCIDNARGYNLSYVYVAPQFATEDAEAIAREIGGQIAVINPIPRDYITNMRNVTTSLARELE